MYVAYNIDFKYHNPQYEYCYHEYLNIPTPIPCKFAESITVHTNTFLHSMCLDERLCPSVTGVNWQLFYTCKYHLPSYLTTNIPSHKDVTFGGKETNRIIVEKLGTITIRAPSSGAFFFEYLAPIVSDDVSMLLGLHTHIILKTVIHKHKTTPLAELRAINVTIPLQQKFGELYYCIPNSNSSNPRTEYLLTTTQLAQIHRNLGLPWLHSPTLFLKQPIQLKGVLQISKAGGNWKILQGLPALFKAAILLRDYFSRTKHIQLWHRCCYYFHWTTAHAECSRKTDTHSTTSRGPKVGFLHQLDNVYDNLVNPLPRRLLQPLGWLSKIICSWDYENIGHFT